MTQAPPKSDPTTAAVIRQIDAMGGDLFELGIRDGATGKMMLRTWSRDELLGAVGWLKRQNLHASDIYIWTKGSPGLVLVDGELRPLLGKEVSRWLDRQDMRYLKEYALRHHGSAIAGGIMQLNIDRDTRRPPPGG